MGVLLLLVVCESSAVVNWLRLRTGRSVTNELILSLLVFIPSWSMMRESQKDQTTDDMNLRSAHENNVRSTRYLELAAVLMHRVSRRDSSFSPIQEPHPDFRNPHSVPGIGNPDKATVCVSIRPVWGLSGQPQPRYGCAYKCWRPPNPHQSNIGTTCMEI